MNWRIYITAFVIALAFIGISLDQSNSDPNQEILVQFNTDSISADQALRAVSDIKSQLRAIGIEEVQVSETSDGRLKVTYYSTVDVDVIKSLFFKQNKLQIDDTSSEERKSPSKFPFTNDSNTYIVDVVKIQNDFNADISLQGVLVEVKSSNNQYIKPQVSAVTSEVAFGLIYNIESQIVIDYNASSLFVEDVSHKIPEGRAGPLS